MKAWFIKCLGSALAHKNVLFNPSSHGEPWGLQYLLQPGKFDTKLKHQKSNTKDAHTGCTFVLRVNAPHTHYNNPAPYVRYCVQILRTLGKLYGMTMALPSSTHPLHKAFHEATKIKRSASPAHELEAKRQKLSSDSYTASAHAQSTHSYSAHTSAHSQSAHSSGSYNPSTDYHHSTRTGNINNII